MFRSKPGLPPRLSEAAHLLPLISGHLDASAWRHPYCASLQLLPIVEDGLFGYELVPARDTHTYVIIGRNAEGRPSLRTVSYGSGGSEVLQMVAVQGRLLSRHERALRYSVKSRDAVFADWHAAANAACAQLRMLFPQLDDAPANTPQHAHRHLEEALRIAHSHLARFDPSVEFFGLPNEAQLGFPLSGVNGERGLAFRAPDTWILRWQSANEVVGQSWSIEARHAAGARTQHDARSFPDRRIHRRRATDRG